MTAAELLITVLVLSTLAAISVPRLSHSASLNKQTRCNSNLELLQSAVELYSSQTGQFPDKLDKVENNQEFFPAGEPKCPLGGTYILKTDHTVICTHP
jgi:type II secretory pathway pseudopilin PulG